MPSTRRDFLLGAAGASALHAAPSNRKRVEVLSVPAHGIQPQVALSEGVVHLIYFSGDPQHGDVFYRSSENFGASFSPAIRVNSQPGSAIGIGAIRGPQLSLGKGNRVHVAWNGSDLAQPPGQVNPSTGKPGSPMLYSRLSRPDGVFEPQRNLMRQTFGLDGGGTVAADRNGNVFVAWHGKLPGAPEGEAGRQVWIARSNDEGHTFGAERLASQEPTGACGCCGMRLFADSHGVLHGLYRSARENVHRDIYTLRSNDNGNSFSVALLHPWDINACPMSSMSIVEQGNDVLAAWETQTQVYFAPLNRGIAPARTAIAAPPGANPKRKYPALARNAKGETLLAWVEGSGWQRGGSLGCQIFDQSGRPSTSADLRRPVPASSFPAVFVRPDDTFAILV